MQLNNRKCSLISKHVLFLITRAEYAEADTKREFRARQIKKFHEKKPVKV